LEEDVTVKDLGWGERGDLGGQFGKDVELVVVDVRISVLVGVDLEFAVAKSQKVQLGREEEEEEEAKPESTQADEPGPIILIDRTRVKVVFHHETELGRVELVDGRVAVVADVRGGCKTEKSAERGEPPGETGTGRFFGEPGFFGFGGDSCRGTWEGWMGDFWRDFGGDAIAVVVVAGGGGRGGITCERVGSGGVVACSRVGSGRVVACDRVGSRGRGEKGSAKGLGWVAELSVRAGELGGDGGVAIDGDGRVGGGGGDGGVGAGVRRAGELWLWLRREVERTATETGVVDGFDVGCGEMGAGIRIAGESLEGEHERRWGRRHGPCRRRRCRRCEGGD
jgi:hypothetical protein